MKHLTASIAAKNFDSMLDDVTRYHEPVTIVSDDSRVAVIISMDEWNSIQETLYLNSIPGMAESIQEGRGTPLAECVPISEVWPDV